MSYARYAALITRALDEAGRQTGDGPLARLNRHNLTRLAEYLYARMHRAGHCCYGQVG